MASNSNYILHLPNLGKQADYIHWKRRMHAFIRRDNSIIYVSQQSKPVKQQAQETF